MEESEEVPGPHKFRRYLTSQEVKVSCSHPLFPLVLFGLLLPLLYTKAAYCLVGLSPSSFKKIFIEYLLHTRPYPIC